MSAAVIHDWLRFLVAQPLYKHYNITVDWSVFTNSIDVNSDGSLRDRIETLDVTSALESELISSRQETVVWSEDCCLEIAPGQHSQPESLIFDTYAEELSFPAIYLGCARQISTNLEREAYVQLHTQFACLKFAERIAEE